MGIDIKTYEDIFMTAFVISVLLAWIVALLDKDLETTLNDYNIKNIIKLDSFYLGTILLSISVSSSASICLLKSQEFLPNYFEYLQYSFWKILIPLFSIIISVSFIVKVLITGRCRFRNITIKKMIYLNSYMFIIGIVPSMLELIIFGLILFKGLKNFIKFVDIIDIKIINKFDNTCRCLEINEDLK